MKDNRLEGQFRRERWMTIVSVASLILFVIAILLVGMVLMYRTGLLTLPEWLSSGEDHPMEVIPGDDGAIYEALQNSAEHENVVVTRDLTPEEVRERLLANPAPTEYTVENRVTVYGGHMQNTITNKISRSGEKYRLECYESDGTLIRVVVCDGSQVSVTEYISRTESVSGIFPLDDEFTLENQAGMPDLYAVYHQLEQTDENARTLTDLTVSLARTSENNVYHIAYGYEQSAIREEVYLSLEYGMVVNAQSTDNGEKIYQLVTISLAPSLGKDDPEELFALTAK